MKIIQLKIEDEKYDPAGHPTFAFIESKSFMAATVFQNCVLVHKPSSDEEDYASCPVMREGFCANWIYYKNDFDRRIFEEEHPEIFKWLNERGFLDG